ncbi:MAG: hypothetical protein L6R28_00900 [Planctomycetes bacterium]|nr:hypothetical protein [Planctomycetota bacterium]
MNPARFLLLLAAIGLLAGCTEKPKPPADLKQEAIRRALAIHFKPQNWQDKPCLVKKNEFTEGSEYPLAGGLPPAKIVDLEELRKLANDGQLSPEWVIVEECSLEETDGKIQIEVHLRIVHEILDPNVSLIPLGSGKTYQFGVQDDLLILLRTQERVE